MYTELEIVKDIIESGAIEIREKPFVYSSGNQGPGYIMIKGLVGQPKIFKRLVKALAEKVKGVNIDFIDGNATGGMITAWELRNCLSEDKEIPYVYLRGSRKEGGHNELITGNRNNPEIEQGDTVLVVEELVNYGQTTINAAKTFRNNGYNCHYAACILTYDHPETNRNLKAADLELISLITLPRLLEVAKEHKLLDVKLIDSYSSFLKNPIEWQLDHGISAFPELTAKKAKNYLVSRCFGDGIGATDCGAPENKIEAGIKYYKLRRLPYLFVALDNYQTPAALCTSDPLARVLKDFDVGIKINLHTFLDKGSYNVLSSIPETKPVFVDLKMWNGGNTMTKIIQKLRRHKYVKIVSVHALAGEKFLSELVKATKHIQIYVTTVLTHYDEEYTQEMFHMSYEEAVYHFAKIAVRAGCDGIILPATCLDTVKDLPIRKLCPGIRPNGEALNNNDASYQKQICSIAYAKEHGADHIVMGSPITKATSPENALRDIMKEIN